MQQGLFRSNLLFLHNLTSVSKSSLTLLLGRLCISTDGSPLLPWPGWGFSSLLRAGGETLETAVPHWQGSCPGCLCSPAPCLALFPSSTAVDLLDKMLQLDVEKRLTATEALAHPYFDQFRDIEEETEAQHSYDDSLEHEKLSIEEWKSKKSIFLWGSCLAWDFPTPLPFLYKCWVKLWLPADASVVGHRSLAFIHSAKIPPALQADFFALSPLSLSAATECLFLHIQHSNFYLCPLKSHINGYFVLLFKSTFTRRSWPSVPLHGRTQRREVGCHYSDGCSCGWDSVLPDDIRFIPHCAACGQLLVFGTSLCVPTQGRHHAVGIGLCSSKGEAPQTVFDINDKYILVETLSERIWPVVSFFFFSLYLSTWERRRFILSH